LVIYLFWRSLIFGGFQNAVVKADAPYVSPSGIHSEKEIPVENFVEVSAVRRPFDMVALLTHGRERKVLVRMRKLLDLLDERMATHPQVFLIYLERFF
jgi:hypothetical protein